MAKDTGNSAVNARTQSKNPKAKDWLKRILLLIVVPLLAMANTHGAFVQPKHILHDREIKALAIFRPDPVYPIEARRRRIQGSGVCVLWIKPDGSVGKAEMVQSTGQAILDNATLDAFRRWRFKPGSLHRVRIPIHFFM